MEDGRSDAVVTEGGGAWCRLPSIDILRDTWRCGCWLGVGLAASERACDDASPSLFRRNDFDRLKAPRTLKAEGGCIGGDDDKGDEGKAELSVLFRADMPTSDNGVGGVAGPMNGAKASKGLANAPVGLPGVPPSAY